MKQVTLPILLLLLAVGANAQKPATRKVATNPVVQQASASQYAASPEPVDNERAVPLPPASLKEAEVNEGNIATYQVGLHKTTHIISPEPILYVDISNPYVEGNLPEKNIFRFKPDTAMQEGDEFQVTLVTEQYVMAYRLYVTSAVGDPRTATVITVKPGDALPTNAYGKVGRQEFDRLAFRAYAAKRKLFNVTHKKDGMLLSLNNVFVVGDYLMFDVTLHNHTNLAFDLEDVRFKLRDKHLPKAHVSQDIKLTPVYGFQQGEAPVIKDKWRNIYLFRKFTYPGEKVFTIEVAEKQVSGRKLAIDVDYRRLLEAPILN